MDEWLREKKAADQAYWDNLGVEPEAWYFGSHTGAFRMWPASHWDECGKFDPRVRPWYVAASSGPKNIVMILDTSGSMDYGRKGGPTKLEYGSQLVAAIAWLLIRQGDARDASG